MSTPYVCTLDAATQKKALEELYEDPKNRQGAIETLRDWILQQTHFKCPTDNLFLLGFLRAKHFSQLEAREAVERFMIQREKLSSWMKNLDTTSDEISGIIESGVLLYLPGTDGEGRPVGIFRPGKLDGSKKKMVLAYSKLFACMGYYNYFYNEQSQVHGTVSIGDWTGHTMAKEMKIPMEAKKNLTVMLTKAFPARVKGIHMYNAGNILEFLMNLIGTLLNEKLKKRLHVHSQLESIYKVMPMSILPEDYLPDDYKGPNAGSEKQIIDGLKAMLKNPEVAARIKHLSSEEFHIDLKHKSSEELATSFRKLNVD